MFVILAKLYKNILSTAFLIDEKLVFVKKNSQIASKHFGQNV